MPSKPKESVSVAKMAALSGKSRSVLYVAKDQGCPHRPTPRGIEFVPCDVFAWFEKQAEERGRRAAESETGDTPYNRKLAVEADYKAAQLERLRGNLLDANIVREEYEKFVAGFAGVAASQLQRFERDIVATTTPADARRLTQRIHAGLMDGAQQFAATIQEDDVEDDVDGSELDESEDAA